MPRPDAETMRTFDAPSRQGLCSLGLVVFMSLQPAWADTARAALPAASTTASAPSPAPFQRWRAMGCRALALVVGGGLAWGLYRLARPTPPDQAPE